jgi:hypothetical protein
MSNAVPEKTKSLEKYFQELSELEGRIASEISPEILDYLFLLDSNSKRKVSFNTPLTNKQISLLQEYNALGITVSKEVGIDLKFASEDVFEKFIEVSHEIYLMRFIEARKYFVEYALVRVLSEPEMLYLREANIDREQMFSIEIVMPEALILEASGKLDFDKTEALEARTNQIASTLSSYSNLFDLSSRIYTDLYNLSMRTFLISMNQNLLVTLLQDVLHIIIIEANKEVYKYLNSGYRPTEAIDNVKSMFKKSKNSRTVFPDRFVSFQKDIEEIIDESLQSLKNNDIKLISELKTQIIELLILYIREGLVVSSNFYKVDFIHHNDLSEATSKYKHIINTYLIDDFGKTLREPSETYDIRFSQRFKKILFNLLTNGNINPILPLEKYLTFE